ncbi:Rieske 2Fe-2S domain-containing protein [Mycolicibacterium boenickei]|uniref:Rieske 2Fe-2S domain-containing protein n=1 Tax=Mycolicibacterium boenickei TaxID=146017 RepID=UPI00098B5CBF|nr:Rieske 2Fe-2S domain-containing protein [Mycolicibacterium boenickei]
MQVTSVGHAGFLIQTKAGSILCDPWVNPAYFASWFPFPDNSGLDWDTLGDVDYLYVSHLHKDHFDPENLYTFFKCLTDERIAYADGWFAEAHDDTSSITLDGWEIQRRCPHLKADLSKFGVVEGNTLTCNLHGWQWNLENGKCLTTKGHELRCSKQ